MKPEEFEARLNSLLDERLGFEDDAQLVRAARESAQCRTILASYSALVEGTLRLSVPTVSDDLTGRVVARLRAAPAEEPRVLPLGRGARWWFATAAAVVACALPASWYLLRDQFANPDQVAHPLKAAIPIEKPSPAAPEVATVDSPADAFSPQSVEGLKALMSLAREARRTASDAVLRPLAVSASASEVAGENGPVPGRLLRSANIMGQVSEGLQPLTDSAVGAIDFLFEVLPGRDNSRS